MVGKKGSKRNKKNWRKLDSAVYDEGLKNYNSQLFTGGLVSEKPDEDLFFTDKKKKREIVKEKNINRLTKPLRCLQALENKSIVNISRKATEPRIPKSNKKKSTIITKPDSSDFRRIVNNTTKSLFPQEITDIWSQQKEEANPSEVTEQKYHKSGQLKQEIFPHPGLSYNPSDSSHQKLLWDAHLVVKKDEDEQNRVQEIYNEGFKIPREELERRDTQMMKSCLDDVVDNGNDVINMTNDVTMAEDDVMRISFRRERKTRAQVNVKKRNLIKERRRIQGCLNSKREKQFGNLTEICKKLDGEERRAVEKRERTYKKRALSKLRTRRLAKLKFKEPLPLDIKLSDELPSSMVKLAPEGSLLKDHYINFQKRNMICPSQRLMRKKTKHRTVLRRNLRNL